jgi:hypothetical protein
MPKCETCVFWTKVSSAGVGTCSAVDYCEEASCEAIAYVIDGSDYWAALQTRALFGCILHRPKDDLKSQKIRVTG